MSADLDIVTLGHPDVLTAVTDHLYLPRNEHSEVERELLEIYSFATSRGPSGPRLPMTRHADTTKDTL